MSRFTKRDTYGHAYTNETIYDRGMTSEDGVHFEKQYFENGSSAYDGKPIDRLCELEDKIEQGDVVEVTRCKDCKFNVANMEIDENDGTDYSGKDIVCSYFMTDGMEENDYCSRGERREE